MNPFRNHCTHPIAALLVMVVVIGLSDVVTAAGEPGCDPRLPTNSITFVGYESPESFAAVTLSQVPPGFAVTNGSYLGWCINYDDPISYAQAYSGKMFSSLASALPAPLQALARDKVNYILNHKQGTLDDVQNAIWHVLGQTNAPVTPVSQTMVAAATASGVGFVPGTNEVVAIIVEPDEVGVQRLVIESRCSVGAGGNPDYGPVRILSITTVTDQHIELRVSCAPGPSYVIESATNLVNWTPVATVVNTNLDGVLQFMHTNAMDSAHRFYRVSRP